MSPTKKLDPYFAYIIRDNGVIERCDPRESEAIYAYRDAVHPDVLYTIQVLKDVAIRSETGTLNANFVYQFCQVILNQASEFNAR